MSEHISKSRITLVAALLLTASLSALAGTSVFRKVQSFQPLGFEARHGVGAGWEVTAVDDPATPLRIGDLVMEINGLEITDLAGMLRGRAESTLLVERGDDLGNIVYHRPGLDLDFPFLILAVIGAGYLLIGFYTLLKNPQRPGLLFHLWCLSSAAVYLLTTNLATGTPDDLGKGIYIVEELARLLLPALTLHLFLVFPSGLPSVRRLNAWIPFLYLPATILATLQLDLIFFDGRYVVGPPRGVLPILDRVELFHLAVFVLAALAVVVARLLHNPGWDQHRQVQWIALGLGAGFLPFAAIYLVPYLFEVTVPETVTSLAVLPLSLVPLTFAWAILRYKLWDFEVLVRDTLSYTLTLLFGAIGFSLIHLAISRGVAEEFLLTRNFLSFGAALAVAGLMLPTRTAVGSTLERFQYRGSFGKRRALTEMSRDLLRERDLMRLCSRLIDQLEDSVPVERANLYLAGKDFMVPVNSETGIPRRLDQDALGAEIWGQDLEPISCIALPAGRPLPAQSLFRAGYRYAFPLTVMDHRVALLLTTYRPDQSPLNSDDEELIRQSLDRAALAIENAQLLVELQDKLDEVVRLKEYNAGIVESSPAGIAVLDADGHVVSANDAFRRLTSAPDGEAAGLPLEELLPIKPLPSPRDGLVEVSYCDLSGEEHYLQISISAFTGSSGEALRNLVVHDVSERVAMENALRESERLASLGMVAAGVAHEVNTPITGISSYAQMLLEQTPEDDPRYEMLKKVERQTFRAARIVNNLLELARDRSGERHPVDLVALVSESLELLRERTSKRGVRVEWRPPEGSFPVMGCDGELQQVVTNLLINGTDAMAESGGALRVGIEGDEGWIQVEVMDSGVGIPKSRLEKIFQPFFSTKLAQGGTGLGLSISHQIIRRHGGDLTVTSEAGRGSCFTMRLPRLDESE